MGGSLRELMNRYLTVAAVALAGFTVTGCASATATEPTPTVGPNAAACADAAELAMTIPDVVNAEDGYDGWEEMRDQFDEIALRAEGTVAERMQQTVDEWPEGVDVILFNEFDSFNESLAAVERACAADDADADFPQLTAK